MSARQDATPAIADDAHAQRRKRLAHAARYRGTLEADIVFRRFVERELGGLDAAALDRFEKLLDEPDQFSWEWITERAPTPARHDNDVMKKLRACRDQPDRA